MLSSLHSSEAIRHIRDLLDMPLSKPRGKMKKKEEHHKEKHHKEEKHHKMAHSCSAKMMKEHKAKKAK